MYCHFIFSCFTFSYNFYSKMSYYALDNYGDFEDEQELLAGEARRKEDFEKSAEDEKRELELRFKCIRGYFLRFSWSNKKQFILSVLKMIDCFDTLLRIISYLSTSYGKIAAYAEVSPHCKMNSQHIFIDHNRAIEEDSLKEAACEDISWMGTIPADKQVLMIINLLKLGGSGLRSKVYIPAVNIYNKKIMEHVQLKGSNRHTRKDLSEIFEETCPIDDSDQYPREHPLSIEVEKSRKKWDETIGKYKREVLAKAEQHYAKILKPAESPSAKVTKDKNKKPKNHEEGKTKQKEKTGKKSTTSDGIDWVQMLPIWVVKKIFGHLDQKTLINLKKVNNYWSYICDSLIKDKQARSILDEAIAKMTEKINPKILKEYEEGGHLLMLSKQLHRPGEIRIKKLLNRGAVLEDMRPVVEKSQQTRTCLTSLVTRTEEICDSVDKQVIFPRLIKDDLLLYKEYPCALKDVNIIIDVEESLEEQRDTMLFSLSRELSDTFSLSLSDTNIQDW